MMEYQNNSIYNINEAIYKMYILRKQKMRHTRFNDKVEQKATTFYYNMTEDFFIMGILQVTLFKLAAHF